MIRTRPSRKPSPTVKVTRIRPSRNPGSDRQGIPDPTVKENGFRPSRKPGSDRRGNPDPTVKEIRIRPSRKLGTDRQGKSAPTVEKNPSPTVKENRIRAFQDSGTATLDGFSFLAASRGSLSYHIRINFVLSKLRSRELAISSSCLRQLNTHRTEVTTIPLIFY